MKTCSICKKEFHSLGYARHRTMHYDKAVQEIKLKDAILKDQTKVRCKKCGKIMYLGFYTWYGCETCKEMNGYESIN